MFLLDLSLLDQPVLFSLDDHALNKLTVHDRWFYLNLDLSVLHLFTLERTLLRWGSFDVSL